MVRAKSKFKARAHVWAIKVLRTKDNEWLPDEVVVILDAKPKRSLLDLGGWSISPTPSEHWTFDQLNKSLDEVQRSWEAAMGEGWQLEIREEQRFKHQPPVLPPRPILETRRIVVAGQLQFPNALALRSAISRFLRHPLADESAILEADLKIAGLNIVVDFDESVPTSCWTATVCLLRALAFNACEGLINAEFDGGRERATFQNLEPTGDIELSDVGRGPDEDIDEVAVLLSGSIPVPDNDDDDRLSNQVRFAARRGALDRLRALLDEGGDVEQALYGAAPCIRLALARGIHPDGRNGGGAALRDAIWRANVAGARMLLEAGADVELRNPRNGYTPLMLAASLRDLRMIRLLLSAGATPQVNPHS